MRTAEAAFVRSSDLVTVEDLDPEGLPATSGSASDGNHGDVRGATGGHTGRWASHVDIG